MPTSLQPIDTTSANYLYCPKTINTPSSTTSWQVSYWVYNVNSTHYILYTDGIPIITIMHYPGRLQVSDGTLYTDTILTGTGVWSYILITKTAGGPITVFQDDILATTTGTGINSSCIFNSNITFMRGGATIFDLRIKVGSATAAAWTYYFNDIPFGGDAFLPQG